MPPILRHTSHIDKSEVFVFGDAAAPGAAALAAHIWPLRLAPAHLPPLHLRLLPLSASLPKVGVAVEEDEGFGGFGGGAAAPVFM